MKSQGDRSRHDIAGFDPLCSFTLIFPVQTSQSEPLLDLKTGDRFTPCASFPLLTSVHPPETNGPATAGSTAADADPVHEPVTFAADPRPLDDVAGQHYLLDPAGFRHSGWSALRDAVHDGMFLAFLPEARIKRFLLCGSNAWVLQDKEHEDHVTISVDKCRDRFCRPCGRERAFVINANLSDHIKHRTLRFVTLTLRANDHTLKHQIDRLLNCFSALRRREPWTTTQLGGVAFLEVKRSSMSDHWHPHLHILTEGKYIPHQQLKAAWHLVTGDSTIVDVKPVPDNDVVRRYVTKYVSKPLTADVIRNEDHLVIAIRALHGRRLCTTFGSWRGLKLTDPKTQTEWKRVAPVADILRDAASGDAVALRMVENLRRMFKCPTKPP